MTSRRIVDRFSGSGRISHGDETVATVECSVTVWQDVIESETLGGSPQTVSGHPGLDITVQKISRHVRFPKEGLTLHLADGRRIPGSLIGNKFMVSGNIEGP